jgi:hypothetical protein
MNYGVMSWGRGGKYSGPWDQWSQKIFYAGRKKKGKEEKGGKKERKEGTEGKGKERKKGKIMTPILLNAEKIPPPPFNDVLHPATKWKFS